MKTHPFLALLAAAAVAHATTDADIENEKNWSGTMDFKLSGRAGSFTLDVHEAASSRKITRNWESGYGSYDRDFTIGKTLAVDVSFLGQTAPPADALIEVIWFAQDLASKKLFVYSRKGSPLAFAAGAHVAKVTSELPPLESNVQNYAALGERYVDGSKLAGWLVCIRDGNGAVYRHRTSNPTIEALTRDNAIAPLVDAFEKWRASYRK